MPWVDLGCRKAMVIPSAPLRGVLSIRRMPLASASASCSSIFSQASAMWWIPTPRFSMYLAMVDSSGNSDDTVRQRKTKLQKEAEKQEKEAEKEKKKEAKKDTKLVSYEMFRQGMNIDEIAKTRDLVSGTIAGHLEHYVRSGKIKVEQVVKAENIAKIRKYLDEHEYMGIFAIKVALGDDVSYADIKFVLAVSGH